eukprot:COSAG02_NODE_25609_length_653_cov_1.371841_1_plen_29_part_10
MQHSLVTQHQPRVVTTCRMVGNFNTVGSW